MSQQRASFTGGMGTRWGVHASGPMATLEFDTQDLMIRPTPFAKFFGLGEVRASRDSTKAIRLSTGVLAVRVSVIRSDGTEVEPFFTLMRRGRVRTALAERGWSVIEDRWKFGRRS